MNDNKPIEQQTAEPAEALAIEVAQPTLPKKRGRPAKVSKEMFMDVWNGSTNLNEVAQTLGMPNTYVSVKASMLRKEGRELKRFTRGRKRKIAR